MVRQFSIVAAMIAALAAAGCGIKGPLVLPPKPPVAAAPAPPAQPADPSTAPSAQPAPPTDPSSAPPERPADQPR
jgi:predicted small lipoprotein YifL